MNINDILSNTNFLKRSIIGISVFFILLAASTFFYILYQWKKDWELIHEKRVATAFSAPKIDETQHKVATLKAEHLFGNAFVKTGPMPISDLELRVTGIVKVSSEKFGTFSKAFISISGQPSKIFQIGDKLPDGVKIYDIASDAVILENDGHLEKLPLPRESLKFKPKSSISSIKEQS